MPGKTLEVALLSVLLAGMLACSSERNAAPPAPTAEKQSTPVAPNGTSPLIGRIWQLSNSPYGAASGSIYVFLPNGTLLETSCVETYRIATWTADKSDPNTVHVVEDQRPAFDASIKESSGNTIQLQQKLAMGNRETRDLTLTAIDKEFVCADMKK